MRTKRTFQPAGNEALEDRSVPSAGGGLSSVLTRVSVQDAKIVAQAFKTFDSIYKQDVASILLAPGTVDPSANRANFDAAVGAALNNLNATIDSAISNLSTSATLGAQIENELLGPDSATLQSKLASIPTPKVASFGYLRQFDAVSDRVITGYKLTISGQVASAPVPTPPSSQVSGTVVKIDLRAIHQAFQSFSHIYNTDVNMILLPRGTMVVSNYRAVFDSAIASALNALNGQIASALQNSLPPSLASSFAATVQNDLLTGSQTDGLSLQSRLANLATPTSVNGTTPWLFRLGSTMNINFAEREMQTQFGAAVTAYNAGL